MPNASRSCTRSLFDRGLTCCGLLLLLAPAAGAQTARPLVFRIEAGPDLFAVLSDGNVYPDFGPDLDAGFRSRLSAAWPWSPRLSVVAQVGAATVGVLDRIQYSSLNAYEQHFSGFGTLNDGGLGLRWNDLGFLGGRRLESFAGLNLTVGRRALPDTWRPALRTAWLAGAEFGWVYWLNSFQGLTLALSYQRGLRPIWSSSRHVTYPGENGQLLTYEVTSLSRGTNAAVLLGYQWRLGKPPRPRYATPRNGVEPAPDAD